MPASTISTVFIPKSMKLIVPTTVDDIDDPEDFMKTIISATQLSDLPKMNLDPRSYKIIGAIIKDNKDLDTLFVSDEYKAYLKKRGRHANQDIRVIMKMIVERYVIIGGDMVMSMHTNNMSKWVSMKPQASVSFRPLSYAETEHIVTIRYRIDKKALYTDITLAEIINAGRHLLSNMKPNDAFCYRHVNRMLSGNNRDTFSIRNLAHTSKDVFGSADFDRPMKHLLDNPRPINIVIITEHVTTVTSFIKDILCAFFGDDAHVVTKTTTCNYVYEYARGYKAVATDFEDEYGPPGIILYSPRFIPAAVDDARSIFSSITVVMDIEDADDPIDGVERIILTAEPRTAYHSGHPTYKDMRDYITYLRNIDTESESEDC